MTLSPHLQLPLVAAGQAQKHVTVNEALIALDALIHLAVDSGPQDNPPSEPEEASRWIVGATPAGAWAGQAHKLAVCLDGGWRFHVPRRGWLVQVAETVGLLVFDGAAWSPLAAPQILQQVARLGVGTDADATNPLSARLNNVLLTARPAGEGGDDDLRLKLNKLDASDTASLVFQTGFSGRAEIGALGNDDLQFKISADGVDWATGLVLERNNGVVRLPANPKFRASASADMAVSADSWTKTPFDVATHDPLSDFDVAAHAYVVPVAGFYIFGAQIGHTSDGTPTTTAYGALFVDGVMAEES